MTNLDDLLNGPTVVYTDAEILERNALKGRCRVELAALRARLAAMEEALREISGPSQDCFECSSQHIARAALAAKEDRHGAR